MLATENDILDIIAKMKIPYNLNINLRKTIDNCLACGTMNNATLIKQNILNFIR